MAADSSPAPMPAAARAVGNVLLLGAMVAGVDALLGDAEQSKCLGLIAAFFAPVLAIIWNLGSRYFLSHWKLFLLGWAAPGWWTVAIDCVGQQQNVWSFPPTYLTGIATLDGWLKLDIAAVYLVSTFAVTATGAIILAAADEFSASARAVAANPIASGGAEQPTPTLLAAGGGPEVRTGEAHVCAGDEEASLWDLGLFIFGNAFAGALVGITPTAAGGASSAPGRAVASKSCSQDDL